jgi:hypothetical protein
MNGWELVVNMNASSRKVGALQPKEIVRGTVSCQVPSSYWEQDWELHIKDDLGLALKADNRIKSDLFVLLESDEL